MLKLRQEFLEISKVKILKNNPEEEKGESFGSQEEYSEEDASQQSSSSSTEKEDEEVGLDILLSARTIASAAMQIFRIKYLKPYTLPIFPNNNYIKNNDKQSELALRYFKHLEETMGVEIQTSTSPNGEYKVPGTNFSLDGYVKRNDGRPCLGLEFHGCVWHACHRCIPNDDEMLPSGKTAGKVREEHNKRMRILKNIGNLNILEFWECDVMREIESNIILKKKIANYLITTPWLRVRDGFVGGRTETVRMLFNSRQNSNGFQYKIRYLDYTSLYPYAQTRNYPVGHPMVIIIPTQNRNVFWTEPKHIEYSSKPLFGFIKVVVTPPVNILNSPPVLPMKVDERLLFALCRRCALDFPHGSKQRGYCCRHSDADREFVWTGTTIELAEALRQGYIVRKVFSALHYEQFSDQIFRGYVSDFMKMKIHASGFDPEMKTKEQQQQFITECRDIFNIIIDRSQMNPNPAKRTLAKLANNSLWGKFAERDNLSRTVTTDSPAVLRNLLDNPKLDVMSIDLLTKDVIMITYKKHKDFIESNNTNNLAVAAWTTSLARLRLLEALQAVTKKENSIEKSAVALYWDTDSVIYGIREGYDDPLKNLESPHLGGLKDEKPDYQILEFCSCGPKNYALMLQNNISGEIIYEMKIRGLTLDYSTCKILQYNTFKEQCLNFGKDDHPYIYIDYANVIRPCVRTGNVHTQPLRKLFRPVIRKGIVDENYKVIQFGNSK
jgi:hypothetical protein